MIAAVRLANHLTWRNIRQHRLRAALSVLAVALGVAMVVAADVISAAILNAIAGSEDAQLFMRGLLEQLGTTLTLLGAAITLAAGFMVFNAFAMAVTQRRREIGGLRALGMTQRQVLQTVLFESLCVGALGVLTGLLAGPLLGRGAIALIKALMGEQLFTFAPSNASSASLLLAAGLGLGVTLASALVPAWQATRVSPLEALREHGREAPARRPQRAARLQSTAGLGVAVVLLGYVLAAPPGEWVEYPWDQNLAGAGVVVWLACWGLITPALIGGLGRALRRPLARRWGATGRLIADNLGRGRGRVTLTALSLVAGLTMIIGMTGFMHLAGDELLVPTLAGYERLRAFMVAPFDVSGGMESYSSMQRIELPPGLVDALHPVVEGQARISDQWLFTIVPQLSFFGASYFSFITDARDLQAAGDVFFVFTEGDWERALPIMERGCGVLVPPLIASRNGVTLGDTFEVSGRDGPVACTVAGIGRTFVNVSFVGLAAVDEFAVTPPFLVQVIPLVDSDRDQLRANLQAFLVDYPGTYLIEPEGMFQAQMQIIRMMPHMFNALLLLAMVAAALGVVNTTIMSVTERRRELGLLRAVGATRRQTTAVVVGEAALIGLAGGGLGLVVGLGVVLIIVLAYGGNSWGVPDLDLWGAALRSARPALVNGLVGLVSAPPICALAAYPVARSVVRGTAIETLQAERRVGHGRKGRHT